MSIIKAIIKWGIRIAMFFICIYPHNWGLDNYSLVVLCMELGASLIGLCRLEPENLITLCVECHKEIHREIKG